jgi:hypothetical protein
MPIHLGGDYVHDSTKSCDCHSSESFSQKAESNKTVIKDETKDCDCKSTLGQKAGLAQHIKNGTKNTTSNSSVQTNKTVTASLTQAKEKTNAK